MIRWIKLQYNMSGNMTFLVISFLEMMQKSKGLPEEMVLLMNVFSFLMYHSQN